MDDGTSGLWYIKRLGGVVLVQNPFEAAHGSMPQNVLQHVDVDKVFSVTKLPALLQQFMEGKINATDESSEQDKELLNKEVIIASPDNALELGVMNPGILSPFTCPECHTRLFSIKEANDTRFICPAGHAFSSSALLEELTKSVEETLWSSLRGLEETIMLLETKGKEFETNKDRENSLEFYKKAEEVQKQSHAVRKIIFDHEHLG